MSNDLYNDLDLDEVFEEREKKHIDDINKNLEKKYADAIETISQLQNEKKELEKKLKIMEINFKSLIETIRPELSRKDAQIATLRREKDDICFRRKPPTQTQTNEDESAGNCIKEQQNNLGNKLQRDTVESMSSTISIDTNPKIEKDSSSESKKRSPALVESKSQLLEKTNSFNKRARDKDDKESRYHEKHDKESRYHEKHRYDRHDKPHRIEKYFRNGRYDRSREIKSDNSKESHTSYIDKKQHAHRDRHKDNENQKDEPKLSRDRDNHRSSRRKTQNFINTERLALEENRNTPKNPIQPKILSKRFCNDMELDRRKFRKERKRKMRNPNKNILANNDTSPKKLTEGVSVWKKFNIPNKRIKDKHFNSPNVLESLKDESGNNCDDDNKFKFPNLTKLNGDAQLKQSNIMQLIDEYRGPINSDYLHHQSDAEDDKNALHKTLREYELKSNNEGVFAVETDEENFYKNGGTDSDEIIIEETDDEHYYANVVPTQKFYCQPIKSEMCDQSVNSFNTNDDVQSENWVFQPFNFEGDTMFESFSPHSASANDSKDSHQSLNRSLYDINSKTLPCNFTYKTSTNLIQSNKLNIDNKLQIKKEDDIGHNDTYVDNISVTGNDLDLKMQGLEALVAFHEKQGRFLGLEDNKTYETNFTEKFEYKDFLNYFKLKNIKNEKFDDSKLLHVNTRHKCVDLKKTRNKLKNMYKKHYTYNNSKTFNSTKKQTKLYNHPRKIFN